jgi:hypothetical protein
MMPPNMRLLRIHFPESAEPFVGAQIKENRVKHLMVAASIIMAITLSGCKEIEASRSLENSVRLLQAAKTMNELDKAVGDRGIVLTFPDGTWMAIRYIDRHEPTEAFFSSAVARDSENGWFHSDYHFCGYLAAYRHTIMGKQGRTEADIDTNFKGIHTVATSADLATARKNLKALNFRRLKK